MQRDMMVGVHKVWVEPKWVSILAHTLLKEVSEESQSE